MKNRVDRKIWIGFVIVLLGFAVLSCRSSSGQTEKPDETSMQKASATPLHDPTPLSPGVTTLPTVTPLALDEPTLPPEALSMQAAPTATPSPIPPPPSPTPTPTPTPTSVPATGHDDAPMVEVPAGEFLMGVTEDTSLDFFRRWHTQFSQSYLPAPHFSDQTPQLTVYLDNFFIDQFEVTNIHYRRCVQSGVCSPSNYSDITNYDTDQRYDHHPALVTWTDAWTYCQWVGKRLPTEAEWEKAARGTDGYPYPWGREWQPGWANLSGHLTAVGDYPQDFSSYGAMDMGGNAQEWTADWYRPYPGNPRWLDEYDEPYRVVRGGGQQGDMYFLTTYRQFSFERLLMGFRCVQGPEPPTLTQVVVHVSAYPTAIPSPHMDLNRMVYVPAGEFIMGNDDVGDDPIRQDEQPAHIVYLDAFYMDQYEVTVVEFATFLNVVGGHKWRCGLDCIYTLDGEKPMGLEIQIVEETYVPGEGYENLPVTIATWEGAQTYCEWAGKRLPTEAEWEKAARGTDGRLYPWGDEWNPGRPAGASWRLSSNSSPFAVVGSYPGDMSPYGVYDMLGNAPEWLADWYDPEYYHRSPYANPQGPNTGTAHVVRGGFGPVTENGITDRTATQGITGFRCVYVP